MKKEIFKKIFLVIMLLLLSIVPYWRVLFADGMINNVDLNFPINYEMLFEKTKFVWNSNYFNGNTNIIANQHNFFYFGFIGALSFVGLSLITINKLTLIIPFFLLLASLYGLFSVIFKKDKIVAMAMSACFLFSYATINAVFLGWNTNYILPLSAIFASYAIFLDAIQNKKASGVKIVLISLLSIFSYILIQFVGLLYFLMILTVLLYRDNIRNNLRFFIKIVLVSILINFWWLLVFFLLSALYSYSQYRIDKNLFLNEIASAIDFMKAFTLRNSILGQTIGDYQFANSTFAWQISIYLFVFLFLFFKKNKSKLFYVFSLAFIIFLELGRGGNSFIYSYLYKHAPFFYIYRDISKIMPFALLSFIILLGMAIQSIDFKWHWLKSMLCTVIVIIFIFVSRPLVSGNLGGALKPYKLPKSYYEYSNLNKNEKIIGNSMILPMSKWFSNFSWNRDSITILNPMTVANKNFIYDEFGGLNLNAVQKLYEFSYFNEKFSVSDLLKLYSISNVNKIIIQKDQLIAPLRIDNSDMSDIIKKTILKIEDDPKNKKTDFGEFSIYRINKKYFLPRLFIAKKTFLIEDSVDKISEIINHPEYDIGSVMYFRNQNEGKVDRINNFRTSENIPVVEYKKINPIKYRIRLHGCSKQDLSLNMLVNYHAGWKVYLVNSGQNVKNETQNLDLSAYRILDGNSGDQSGVDELREYINKGWVTTIGDLSEGGILHKKWDGSKEELDYVEKYNIDFISKNFQGTIQNDNLPSGKFWETWMSASYKVESSANYNDRFKSLFELNKNVVELPEENHLMVNGYANSWVIDTDEVCAKIPPNPPFTKGESNGFCKKNEDGTYDMELIVEFWPQRLFYIGLGISGATLAICLIYLAYGWRKRKKLVKISEKQ